jgi:chorismate dehydratase
MILIICNFAANLCKALVFITTRKIKMMEKTRVSIVSYLNSKPFLYGLNKSLVANEIDLSLDIPSKVASKLAFNLADIGLIPVAGLEDLDDYQIIGDYCIGSIGKVRTVVLVSEVPLEQVETVLMDYQSRSSVLLAKVLAKFYWKKLFKWENTCTDFQNSSIKGKTAGVVIGDRVFDVENKFRYIYDLSEEWYNFTHLPFVFAVWAANKKVTKSFESSFNAALAFGIGNLAEIIRIEQPVYPNVDIADYFAHNISFELDNEKRAGMKTFLELAQKLELVELK